MAHGYAAPILRTFLQAQELGIHGHRGEKGTLVIYAITVNRVEADADTGEEEERQIPFINAIPSSTSSRSTACRRDSAHSSEPANSPGTFEQNGTETPDPPLR